MELLLLLKQSVLAVMEAAVRLPDVVAGALATPEQQISWAGCVSGVIGSALLAGKGRYAGWGFVGYMAANVAWLSFGIYVENWALIIQSLAFSVTSAFGIRRWLFVKDEQVPA